MERRRLLKLGASLAGGVAIGRAAEALPTAIPVIDTHIHLFDPTRPGGVPWPEKTDTAIYKTTLPDRYVSIAGPLGVVGAIVIEASPLAVITTGCSMWRQSTPSLWAWWVTLFRVRLAMEKSWTDCMRIHCFLAFATEIFGIAT